MLSANGLFVLNKINEKYATRVATRTYNNRDATTSRTVIDHVISDLSHFSYSMTLGDSPLSDHREILLSFDDHRSDNFLCIEETKSYEI